jgi:hypothetical protein
MDKLSLRNFKNIVIIAIILTAVVPIIILFFNSSFRSTLTQFFTGKLSITEVDFPQIKDLIYYQVNVISIVITGFFSYMVFKVTERSNDLAEKNLELTQIMAKRDDQREMEKIKENAFIVYYDLLLGLNDIKKLYVAYCINDLSNSPEQMFFSNEWIKNVAALKNVFDEESKLSENNIDYIEYIYELYGDLLVIKDILSHTNFTIDKNIMQNESYNSMCISVKKLVESLIIKDCLTELKDIRKYFELIKCSINQEEENYKNFCNSKSFVPYNSEQINRFESFPSNKEKIAKWYTDNIKIDIQNELKPKYKSIFEILKKLINS